MRNGQDILADEHLARLFNIEADEIIKFKKFQTYLARSYNADWKVRESAKQKAVEEKTEAEAKEVVEQVAPVKESKGKSKAAPTTR